MADDDLLEPPEALRPKDAPAGPPRFPRTRPEGEPRRGPLALLGFALNSLVWHFWRLLGLSLCATLTVVALVLPPSCLLGAFLRARPHLLRAVLPFATWPLSVPLYAGVGFVGLLIVHGRRPRYRLMFQAFVGRRLYQHTLLSGAIALLLPALVNALMSLAPALRPESFVEGPAVVRRVLRGLPYHVAALAASPLWFAPLHVMAARRPWKYALRASVRFARQHTRLFLTCVLLVFALGVLGSAFTALPRQDEAQEPEAAGAEGASEETWRWSELVTPLALLLVFLLMQMCVLVLQVAFYREMLWREREGEEN